MEQNYTLGRGKLYFDQFAPGTQTPTGERYLGNTPEFSISVEEEKLDHYGSDAGVREKDASITLQQNRSGAFTTDHVSPQNLSMFFYGSASKLTVAGGAVVAEPISNVKKGLFYQLGVTPTSPAGARKVTAVVVKVGAVTKALGTDYAENLELGRIEILEGGTIADDADLLVDYTASASTRDRIISGSTAIVGTLRYVADNAAGDNLDWFMPYVTITPNGEFPLKGDEWQVIPFNVEVLKKTGLEAFYVDGRPL